MTTTKCNLKCCDSNSYSWLKHQRIDKGLSDVEIGKLVGRSGSHIRKRLGELNIYRPRSKFPIPSKGGRKRSNPIWTAPLSLLNSLEADMLAERYGLTVGAVCKVRRIRRKEEGDERADERDKV